MSTVWAIVLLVGAATVLLKASGPLLLGSRELPAPLAGVVGLLAPALLAALVVTQTAGGDDGRLAPDARLAGLAAAALALLLRLPLLVVVAAAAVVTALARSLG